MEEDDDNKGVIRGDDEDKENILRMSPTFSSTLIWCLMRLLIKLACGDHSTGQGRVLKSCECHMNN